MRPVWIHSPAARRVLVLRFVPALALLSLLWELGHFPLYTLWDSGSAGEIAFAAIHCTAGDVLIGTGALILALILTRAGPPEIWRLAPLAALMVALAVSYTIFSEWMNVEWRESWAYAPAMPTLPLLGTGVAPLLQWLVVPTLALWLAFRRTGRATRVEMIPGQTQG
jgi:hypothetical protein